MVIFVSTKKCLFIDYFQQTILLSCEVRVGVLKDKETWTTALNCVQGKIFSEEDKERLGKENEWDAYHIKINQSINSCGILRDT